MTYVPSRVSEVQDFLSYMVLTLPDFFEPEEEMDLETAFRTLKEGLEIVRPKIGETKFDKLSVLLGESMDLYRSGDERGGGFKLQDMKDVLRS